MAKKKILLIDFDNEFLKFLSRTLIQEGYDIQIANDGLAGFEKFSDFQPDLVIMEAMLPKFHGFELCTRITSHPTKKAPVIIVTGIYKDTVYKTEALKNLGASAFFEKPLNLDDLLAKVYELIGKPEVKKRQVDTGEESVDQLLKEALASAYPLDQSKETVKPAEKQLKREEVRKPQPAKGDDEIDQMLKSSFKDLISTPAAKTPQAPLRQAPVAAPAKSTEPIRHPASGEVRKPEPAISQTPGGAAASKKPFSGETKTTSFDEMASHELRSTHKPEPARAPSRVMASPDETSVPVSSSVNPFKTYIESDKEKTHKKSSGKYIGLAAVVLVAIGLVVVLTVGKKKTPEFTAQPVTQTAAIPTAEADKTKELPAAENLNKEEGTNKEIEKQMDDYRSQQASAEKPAGSPGSQVPRTAAKTQPAAVAAAPFIPQESPKIDVNVGSGQAIPAPAQPALATSGQPEEKKAGSQEAAPAGTVPSKPEEQPVDLGNQKAKTGDVVPLSSVDVEPKVIKQVDPIYPNIDRRAGIKGNIIVNALISENGDVLEAIVIRGIRGSVGIEKEAVNAIKKWKFLPAEKDGVKVKVWKPITIGFGLNK
ncbi:MAG: TonB family protein [Acidobacteriota bacterium]|nr:TonB family protein [Acidobacteriota bacterium]